MSGHLTIPSFDIRYTTLQDAPHLLDWLRSSGMLHYFPVSEGKELENAVQCWIGFCRWNASLTATIEGEPCAIGTLFLMPYRKVAHHCLIKIIVDPRRQRQGIGLALLNNLKHLAKTYFRLEMLHTEIFDNPAMEGLLKKAHFYEFLRQGHYVKVGDRYLTRVLFQVELLP